jgi:hypothetical protein
MDVNVLSDDERMQLADLLSKINSTSSAEPEQEMPSSGSSCPDCEKLAAVVQGLQEHLQMLDKLVMDELIGGITDLYNKNQREIGLGDFKSKYGETFNPYEGDLKELFPEDDLYEKLYDFIDELKSQPDYSDEMGHGKIMEVADMLKNKFGKIKGTPAASVEVTKTEAVPEEPVKEEPPQPSEEEMMMDKIRQRAKKSKF